MKDMFFYVGCVQNSDALSGGDRIFIELAKRWKNKLNIHVITSPEGKELCEKNSLKNFDYIEMGSLNKSKSISSLYFKRLFEGIKFSKKFNLPENSYIYSTSNFITDAYPSYILKKKNKTSKWIGGYFLAPPNPFYGYDESQAKFKIPDFNSLSFYLQDRLSKFLINKFADYIYVTSEPDVKKFLNKKRKENKIIVIKGGVDLKTSDKIKNNSNPEFDAIFIGRLHQQKGVLELIDIWNLVTKKKPYAKLGIIGNGPLESEIKEKIRKNNLEKNIILFGFKDGLEKIKIFKNSKIVLHPALYDSGGMAACEAMACKLPGISYDLGALKTYYPRGMLKTPIGNKRKFAENILLLLNNKKLYNKLKKQSYSLAKEWDWNKRAEEIYQHTFHI